MAAALKFRNPQTGNVGEIDVAKSAQALRDGMVPQQDVEMYNPETQASGIVPAAKAAQALTDGLLPVGSHEHAVATTGKLESFARGAAQGASFGFFDELQAALRAPFGDGSLGDSYRQARDTYREGDKIAQEANPITSTLGNVAGAVGGAFLPGPHLAEGAGLLGQAAFGAKLGALGGVGTSEHDLTRGDVAGVAGDALHGAEFGAAGGLATGAIGGTLGAAGRAAKKYVAGSLDPEVQRMLAMGASDGAIKRAGGLDRVRQGVQVANEEGVFARTAEGHMPDMAQMLDRVEAKLSEKAQALHAAVEGRPLDPADLDKFWDALEPRLAQRVAEAAPNERATGSKVMEDLLGELMSTDGSIPSLWRLKKLTGQWEQSWNLPMQRRPIDAQLYREANDALDDLIIQATQKVGEPGVAELNRAYGGLAKLKGFLADAVDKSDVKNSAGGGFRMSDYVRGSAVGAGVGAITGIPLVGSVAGIASASGGALMRSTSGRLARAKLGEMAGLGLAGEAAQQAAQQQAVQMGLIPRTVEGVRGWISQNAQMIPPELQQVTQQILRVPDEAAEPLIRSLMPLVQQQLAPSRYDSEFDGKITTPQDRITITQQVKALGLPPSVESYKLSQLNKYGTIPREVLAPQKPDYGDELMAYNQRLTQRGY